MEIRNRTPLPAGLNVTLDKRAAEHLVLCVKGTWAISNSGRLKFADEQSKILVVDECVGEPGLSSVRYEADFGPMKRTTDCALVGTAVAPKKGTKDMEVSFTIAGLKQRAQVSGARHWTGGVLGAWIPSSAETFERAPLQWELAVGGTDHTPEDPLKHSMDERNPLGRGFRAKNSKLEKGGSALPQILLPGKANDPVGFGFTGAHWKHRREYAGTYDKAWQEERCPLLPLDFDDRFFNSAAPGLVAPKYLRGGESVEVLGCTASGKLAFKLPSVTLTAEAAVGGPLEPMKMALNTVTVDTDAMRLFLTWRGALHIHKRLPRLEFVTLDAEGIA